MRSTSSGAIGALNPSRVRGMFLGNGRLYFADGNSGNLHSIAWANGAPAGSATLADNTVDWRARALFRSIGTEPNVAPTANFTFNCIITTCEFDATSSTDPDGTIVSFDWDFGDGGLNGTGATTSRTYAAAGTYTVTLTVTDDRGGVDTHQLPVNVTGQPNVPPTAAITSDCSANVCDFDGTGSTDPDGTVVSYLWYFGDGTTGTGAITSHSYSTGGAYTVTLTVTDDDGTTDSTDVTVQVTGPPAGPPAMVPVVPARLLETRVGPTETTVDGQFQGIGALAAGQVLELTVTGRGGVPTTPPP